MQWLLIQMLQDQACTCRLINYVVVNCNVSQAGDSENWAVMRAALRLLTSDGGILDPDDYVSDVVDDREQVSTSLVPRMIYAVPLLLV